MRKFGSIVEVLILMSFPTLNRRKCSVRKLQTSCWLWKNIRRLKLLCFNSVYTFLVQALHIVYLKLMLKWWESNFITNCKILNSLISIATRLFFVDLSATKNWKAIVLHLPLFLELCLTISRPFWHESWKCRAQAPSRNGMEALRINEISSHAQSTCPFIWRTKWLG